MIEKWIGLSKEEKERFILNFIKKLKEIDKEYNIFTQINDEVKFKENPPLILRYNNGKYEVNEEFIKGIAENMLYLLPVAVKDNICVKGLVATAGSLILKNYYPPFNATVIERLIKKGIFISGKTVMDEFGFGSFGVNTFKVAKNAIDKSRVAGGSSSGSAVYVKLTSFPSIAESTGGSISAPSCFNSVYGLTPTYGLVSRYGLIDYANSLDKIGVIASNIYDVAYLLSMIAGKDGKDSTCVGDSKDYVSNLNYFNEKNVREIKVAIPKEFFIGDEKILDKVKEAIEMLKKYVKVKEINFNYSKYALASYYIIATCEASTNLAKFSGLRYGEKGEVENKSFNEYFSEIRSKYFGEEAKRRILLGTFARSKGYRGKYYIKALKVRDLIVKEYKRIFSKFDFIITPTMPILPPKLKEVKNMKPIDIYNIDKLTVPPNLAGVPMINIPLDNFIGLHLISSYFEEEKLLQFSFFIDELWKSR